MLEQQFLTTFNSFSSSSNTARFKDKRNNLIVDFINATYQGNLDQNYQLQGNGVIVDDEFNFIACSNWQQGKLNNYAFIKLANQIAIWGQWKNNIPKDVCNVRSGPYLIFIPYQTDKSRVNIRPKKCLVCHQGKQKMYIATVSRFPQGNRSNREFTVVIEKILSMKEKTIAETAYSIEMRINSEQQNMGNFINFMSQDIKAIKAVKKQNGLFLSGNFDQNTKLPMMSLGLFLDHKKLSTKAIGTFSSRRNKSTFRQGTEQEEDQISLNGLGLSKTFQTQQIIGVFKDDMIVKQLNQDTTREGNLSRSSKKLTLNQSNLATKKLLGLQHMRSMSYQHNYIYFPQIKRIVTLVIQIHKYVQMFDKLSQNGEQSADQSMHHAANKYENQQYVAQKQSSQSSIIDQFAEFKVNLKKDIYHQTPRKQEIVQIPMNSKRPGFIRTKTPRNTDNKSQSRSPSASPRPNPGLNKKLLSRSPLLTDLKRK